MFSIALLKKSTLRGRGGGEQLPPMEAPSAASTPLQASAREPCCYCNAYFAKPTLLPMPVANWDRATPISINRWVAGWLVAHWWLTGGWLVAGVT